MSERYSRLFALPENLYAVGSPVIIAAGTLLKDTQTGKIIAQLKLKSISAKAIKAVKVKLDLFDTAGTPLEESVVYDYLDLNIVRDAEFGQKNPVMVPNVKARSYKAYVAEVVFADRSVWTGSVGNWEPLSKPSRLVFQDYELQRQYKIKFGGGSVYEAKVEKDLWYCTCGALNRDGEVCHVCHNSLSALQTVDMSVLEKEKDARLAEEVRVAAEREKKAAEELAAKKAAAKEVQKKTAKFLKITIPTVCAVVAIVLLLTKVIIPNSKYKDAVALLDAGQYSEAIDAFSELGDYKDASQMVIEAKDRKKQAEQEAAYQGAISLMESGKYEDAITAFNKIRAYRDSAEKIADCHTAILDGQYNDALALLNAGNFVDSFEAFLALDDYKDCSQKADSIYDQYKAEKLKAARVGDHVYYGSYEQDNDTSNGQEYIEWLVLGKQNNQLLVISQYALDYQQYHTSFSHVKWKYCTLRRWLNNDFLNSAFSVDEQGEILAKEKDTAVWYAGDKDFSTEDKVFLLSESEANKYFDSDEERKCTPTDYVIAIGSTDSDNCIWWLRTPKKTREYAYLVSGSGYISDYSVAKRNMVNRYHAVRPAMWINLDSIDTIVP